MNAKRTTKAATKWHDRYPFLGTAPLPVEGFTSAAQFALEQELIFRKTWLKVGRVEQVPGPGDYFVHDIPACRASVIIARGKDARLRAFHNMCSHRGNKLAWSRAGSCEIFSCKLHGWSYALDGSLRSEPDEASFFDLHKKSFAGNPYAHQLHMELLGPHARVSLFGNAGLQPTPVAAQAFRHGSFAVRSDYSDCRLPPGVNPTRSSAWSFDLNVIFPAFIVSVSESSYFTHEFWPVTVDRTIWKSTQYFPKAVTAGQRFSQEYGHVLFRDVILEDGRILEETQSVLASGAKQTFPLHDEELLIRHSHHVVAQRIGAAGRPLPPGAAGKESAHG